MKASVKQFKGPWCNCGKYGHKSADCPEEKLNRQEREKETRTYLLCREQGHIVPNCPKRSLYVGKSGNEKANVGINKIDKDCVSDEQSLFDIGL